MADAPPPGPAPSEKPKRRRGLKDQVQAPPPRPSTEKFLDHFFQHAGGPERVAQMMLEEYKAAAPGSLIRGQILQTVLRTLKSQDAKTNPLDEIGVLSDQDIDRLLDERERAILAPVIKELESERPAGPRDAGAPPPQPAPAAEGPAGGPAAPPAAPPG